MPGRRQSLLTEGGGDCGLLLEPPNVGPVLELHLTPVDDVGVVKDRLNLGVPSRQCTVRLCGSRRGGNTGPRDCPESPPSSSSSSDGY